MKNIIVLGGTGFIGQHLCRRLEHIVESGGNVICAGSKQFDLVNGTATFEWFERQRQIRDIDQIFHLAALYKAGGWPAKHPATQFHANMAMNVNALEAWKQFFPNARFTSVVSYCMYPDHNRPHPETELFHSEPEPYLFSYAFTKKALLIGQEAYAREFGLSATSALLPTVYGPGDSFAENSHVMGALIGKFLRGAAQNLADVEVWGDGCQEREFLFVEDAVDGIINVALNARSPVLNLGTGRAVTIRDLAELIKSVTGYSGRVLYNSDRFVGAKKRILDVTKVSKELGWTPNIELVVGIRKTVANYLKLAA